MRLTDFVTMMGLLAGLVLAPHRLGAEPAISPGAVAPAAPAPSTGTAPETTPALAAPQTSPGSSAGPSETRADDAAPAPAAPATVPATASTPAPEQSAPSLETSSLGHPDAAIGAAVRSELTNSPLAGSAGTPQTAGISEAIKADPAEGDTAANAEPRKPTPEEEDRAALAAFYQARGDEPLWVTQQGFKPKALLAMAELKRAAVYGLDPAAFEVPDLPSPGPEGLAAAESALSLAVLTYARHARGGRIAEPATQLSSYLDRRPQYRDRQDLLSELAKSEDPAPVLVALHPQHPQFERLRQAWLETGRAGVARSAKIPAGESLAPGSSHPDVLILRKRLNVPAAEGADAALYNPGLVAAVKGFQTLKGLQPADGTLTPETRSRLNQSITGNAAQLAANMQMWRFMPADLGEMHVMLNVPEFIIRINKGGETVFTERVTVGLINKQTPIFSDQMERVTFKSRWRVPDSIKVREIWPSLMAGGGMMRQHKLEMRHEGSEDLVDWTKINWSKTSMEDYVIWQPPAPWNQLGIVKFSFPNKHYVFMHDTPDKHMFNWTRRANSHGCMRIRNPLKMAEVVLGADKGWDRARIDDLVKNGPDHNIIELDQKLPVHIVYFTARVGEDGKIETFGDIYGHEKRLTLALEGKWDKIAKGPDHLAPVDEATPPRVAARKKPKADPNADSVQSLVSNALGSAF